MSETVSLALIVLHDSRFQNNDSQSVIGILEVDLNQPFSLIYLVPNFTLTLQDFINHINLEVQTIGFGPNWMGENLHLDITFIGRISNHISSMYRINTRPLEEAISSYGTQFLPAQARLKNSFFLKHI